MFEKFKKFKPIWDDLLNIATPDELQKLHVANQTIKHCSDPMVSKPDLLESAENAMYTLLTELKGRLTSHLSDLKSNERR